VLARLLLRLSVDLRPQQNHVAGQVQPQQQDDDAGQRAVGPVVAAEVVDVEVEGVDASAARSGALARSRSSVRSSVADMALLRLAQCATLGVKRNRMGQESVHRPVVAVAPS
jgi:hypothetical protein